MRKKQKIQIELPIDIDSRYKNLYIKKSSYLCPKLYVKEYRNVFVSHEGLCLKNYHLLPYSAFNICTNYDKSFGLKYYRLVLEQYLVSTYGKSLKKINLNENTTYALIHTKWFNYSFWITAALVRLLMLQKTGKNFTLLYPEEWDSIAYVQQTLQAFPNLKYEKIPVGVHVQVKTLLLPEVRPFTACFNGEELQMVSNYFVGKIPDGIKNKTYPKRIFVTRKKAKYRKIANEQEVINLVAKYGFTVIDFDDMTFWEQVAQMQSAECVVQIHGAGMANVVFAKRNTHVLELLHEYKSSSAYRFPYWTACETMGIQYRCMFNKLVGNKDDSIIIRNDLFVDLFVLESHIKQMLNT
ncbi:MAG: glycosyltransferase family 61 protein [Bacteroidales bacterium]|nr:glycosyltransferase family 61 protein [Bacteroidales bacterium]